MIMTVYEILKPLNLPIAWQLRPAFKTGVKHVVSYHFFNEGDELQGDGEGSEPGGSCQVDVFSKTDYSVVVQDVEQYMKAVGFKLADKSDSIDNISTSEILYHKVLVFNYLESEVIRDGG